MPKALLLTITLLYLLMHLSACHCNGVDTYTLYYGMDIKSADSFTSRADEYEALLRISSKTKTEDGDRKCHRKDLVLGIKESISYSSTTVYCNRDFYHYNQLISQGRNLLTIPTFFRDSTQIKNDVFYGTDITIVIDSTDIETGDYTFYVSGTTSLGNNFIDSTTIKHP